MPRKSIESRESTNDPRVSPYPVVVVSDTEPEFRPDGLLFANTSLSAVTGGVRGITFINSDLNLLTSHDIVEADATGGNITVNLPAISGTLVGKPYDVNKTDGSANTVTLLPNGADTINGAASEVIAFQYTNVTFYSNGTEWRKL